MSSIGIWGAPLYHSAAFRGPSEKHMLAHAGFIMRPRPVTSHCIRSGKATCAPMGRTSSISCPWLGRPSFRDCKSCTTDPSKLVLPSGCGQRLPVGRACAVPCFSSDRRKTTIWNNPNMKRTFPRGPSGTPGHPCFSTKYPPLPARGAGPGGRAGPVLHYLPPGRRPGVQGGSGGR